VTVDLGAGTAQGSDADGDTFVNVENVTGTSFDDTLTGSKGDNLLDGGAGNDTLAGGTGDDTYIVDSTQDHVIEQANAGHDTVISSASFVLGDNLENLVLTGNAANGTGNDANNVITGNDADNVIGGEAGNDTINGGAGHDELDGGTGDDTLSGGDGGDLLFGADGKDQLFGGKGDDELFGEAGNDVINGGDGNDEMIGGAGTDTLIGGKGDDNYVLEAGDQVDAIVETAHGGTDTVDVLFATQTAYMLGSNLEDLVLGGLASLGTGNSLDNHIQGFEQDVNYRLDGGAGDDTLIGNAGTDTLLGNAGNDVLVGGAGADKLDGGKGTDTADYSDSDAGVTIDLGAGTAQGGDAEGDKLSNIENLKGSDFNDILTGDAGRNFLDGGGGNDILAGGAGDDVYVTGGGAVINEAANEGHDTVLSSALTFTLGANVEDLVLQNNAIEGIGNELNNAITGTVADNHLAGMAGNDVLIGNGGDDTLDGGAGNDHLSGGAGNDTLSGGDGVDVLAGGAGDDTYILNTGDAADKLIETLNGGHDVVALHFVTDKAFVLGANFEELDLFDQASLGSGNAGANTLHGFNDAVAYHLDGQGGNDTLLGAGGNDVLAGGTGNDVLDGGGGSDRMAGGMGNDNYFVDLLDDVVVEGKNAGIDTIHASISFDLSAHGANVENLTLTGNGDLNGTGNALNNVIVGNSGDNVLSGNAGNDVLEGGGGADTMDGGAGKDVFRYSLHTGDMTALQGLGGDTINNFESGKDKIDVRDLFQDFGISEHKNPFADGHLILAADGNGNTLVQFDSDGADGAHQPVTLATVHQATVAQTDIVF